MTSAVPQNPDSFFKVEKAWKQMLDSLHHRLCSCLQVVLFSKRKHPKTFSHHCFTAMWDMVDIQNILPTYHTTPHRQGVSHLSEVKPPQMSGYSKDDMQPQSNTLVHYFSSSLTPKYCRIVELAFLLEMKCSTSQIMASHQDTEPVLTSSRLVSFPPCHINACCLHCHNSSAFLFLSFQNKSLKMLFDIVKNMTLIEESVWIAWRKRDAWTPVSIMFVIVVICDKTTGFTVCVLNRWYSSVFKVQSMSFYRLSEQTQFYHHKSISASRLQTY